MQNKAYYIDKTESLVEGISRFPSIYIEGNAAIGKSVAVGMLLEKYPQMNSHILELDLELSDSKQLLKKLADWKQHMKREKVWLVIEKIPPKVDLQIAAFLKEMVSSMGENSRMIFVSREKPHSEFLELLWKRQMVLISGEELLLSLEEVRDLAKNYKTVLQPEIVYEKTGGWAGCVDLMFRMENTGKSEEEILESYEIRDYLEKMIISKLTDAEKQLLSYAAHCPWVNAAICAEVWNLFNTKEILENLQRKNLLKRNRGQDRWSMMPLFSQYFKDSSGVREEEAYEAFMIHYYDKIYTSDIISKKVLEWDSKQAKYCYLRGVYHYVMGNFAGLRNEISTLQNLKEADHEEKEILLNLTYLDPQISLLDWLEMLGEFSGTGEEFRLYQILGNSVTYLCGIRDLSGLFACTKREEKLRADLWKRCLDGTAWKCYQLARFDYYLETERKDQICEEDWELFRKIDEDENIWQLRMAKFYLLCKLFRMQPEETGIEQVKAIEYSLRKEKDSVCCAMAEAVGKIYSPWYGEREQMTKWLRYSPLDISAIGEDNYMVFCCRAKGYLLINQQEHAEKILRKLIPYLRDYHRTRLLAEVFFQYALVNWKKELYGESMKNTIESFIISRNNRYVQFYTGYGKNGQQVVESYIEWLKSSEPERWSYKKKYNYGNVLRMPVEDYLQVILRRSRKMSKSEGEVLQEHVEERLTMMETIVLQDIGSGKSNAEIAEELGVKLPTVKGHIYSLFKKLRVNSRVQAVIKGKELGILD